MSILERLGVDPSLLPKTDVVPPRILILDADGAAYRAAATAKTLPTVLRRFCTEVLEMQFLTNSTEVRLHLTGQGGYKGGRGTYPSFRPYQGNRKGKARPALLEPLRELLGTQQAFDMGMPEEWYCKLHRYWEADDACVMDSYQFKDGGIVVSDDKDLRMTPYPYWELQCAAVSTINDRYGYVQDSDRTNPTGHGLKYFFYQLLAGDGPDNIRGLDKLDGRNVGKAGALKFLEDVACESSAANKVLWAYARNKQDALAEAQLLWMRRHDQDCAYQYLMGLDLDKPLREWVQHLHNYHLQLRSNICSV